MDNLVSLGNVRYQVDISLFVSDMIVHTLRTVRFIRSLARCVKYDAKGGKSRSTFCKVAGRVMIIV